MVRSFCEWEYERRTGSLTAHRDAEGTHACAAALCQSTNVPETGILWIGRAGELRDGPICGGKSFKSSVNEPMQQYDSLRMARDLLPVVSR